MAKKQNNPVENNATEVTITISTPRDGSLAALIETEAKRQFAPEFTKNLKHMVEGKRVRWKEEEWKEAKLHNDICKELVRLAHEYNFPYTALVYFAVASDAHKKTAFERGYRSINVEKAETILRWLEKFAKYNKNPKFFTCEKIVHAFSKFYDTYSKKDKDFNTGMRAFSKMPAPEYKPSQFKTMAQFYDIWFKPFITCAEVTEE